MVFYNHHGKTTGQGIEIPKGIPTQSNCTGSLKDALSFIASGETVVSNSYHGVYWAMLMGRKVLCLPFSNKFSRYRLPPGYSDARSWTGDLAKARQHPVKPLVCLYRVCSVALH